MENKKLATAYSQFLKLYSGLLQEGHHESAYHALCGAVHCAEGMADIKRLNELHRLAVDHGASLDDKDPNHQLSNSSAKRRGTKGIFASLATTAKSMIARIKNEERLAKIKKKRPRAS